MKGISTVIGTILMLMIVIGLSGTAYLFISGALTSKTATTFELIDSVNDTVIIRNSGTQPITRITATLDGNNANIAVVQNIQGLVGHWSMNDNGGTVAKDSSRNNNDGTLVNNPIWVEGKFGKALQFDGVDDYVRVIFPSNECGSLGTSCICCGGPGPSDSPYIPSKGAFVMWFKTSAPSGGLQVITGNNFGGGCDRVIGIVGGILNHNVWSEVNFGGVSAVNDNKWHLLVYNIGDSSLAAYVDGQLYASTTSGTGNGAQGPYSSGFNGADTYNIGRAFGCRYFVDAFNGIVDEVGIYKRPLSVSEIQQLYNGLVPSGQTATVKPLTSLTRGTHTLRLCTGSMCNTAILTVQ